jgi:hypothetical protein
VHLAGERVIVGARLIERQPQPPEPVVDNAELLLSVGILRPHDPVLTPMVNGIQPRDLGQRLERIRDQRMATGL